MLGGGRDQWVAILAGRIVPASTRATDWGASAEGWERAQRFYADMPGSQPDPRAGYVYLSRALHPASFDALARRLDEDPGWKRLESRPDAILYARSH